MPVQILLNLAIALAWMLLHNTWNGSTMMIGYLIGLALLFVLRRFLPQPFYFRKVWAVVKLLLLFLKELLMSSLFVAKEVIRPTVKVRPGIVAVPTDLKSDAEITLFACLITLTPGTLTLEVSPDHDMLFVHSLDIQDAEETIQQMKMTFEKAIMEVTR